MVGFEKRQKKWTQRSWAQTNGFVGGAQGLLVVNALKRFGVVAGAKHHGASGGMPVFRSRLLGAISRCSRKANVSAVLFKVPW